VKAQRRAKWAGMAAALLLLAVDASAQGQQQPPAPDRGDDARPQRMGPGGMGPGPHRQQGRGNGAGPQGMAPPTRPAQVAAEDGAAQRGGQMSREERRQLRRDVHEAGRDLYPERRRGGRKQQNPPPPESAPAR